METSIHDTHASGGAAQASEAWQVNPSRIMSGKELSSLYQRSDREGWLQLTRHLAVAIASGGLWAWSCNRGYGGYALPILVLYGFSLAAMFAPLHECVHRTAFASRWANDGVAWVAGVLSLYNSTFYQHYHKWHHRYTRVVGKDPEYEDAAPRNWRAYLWMLSGIPWWLGKLQGHLRIALNQFDGCPYISKGARQKVRRSTLMQLAVYGGAIALSIGFQQPWFLLYWVLPLAVGQPILRFILIAEHTGCTQDDNPLTNTRTTLTAWPLRLLMWNMSFHAEHHLYAGIPFHALPLAHEKLSGHFAEVAPGYVAVNRELIGQFGKTA
ncbi:MAG: fatty acid desaturase family protein [Cyanobacteria bacterium J06642_12]